MPYGKFFDPVNQPGDGSDDEPLLILLTLVVVMAVGLYWACN